MTKQKSQDHIVYLKFSNGHRIWIIKEVTNGGKYFGIYKKPINMILNKTEVKQNDTKNA